MNTMGNIPLATYNVRSEDNACENLDSEQRSRRLRRTRLGFDANIVTLPGELGEVLANLDKSDRSLRCKPL